LRQSRLLSGLIKFLLGLLSGLKVRLFEVLPGLFGELLFGLGGLMDALLLEFLVECLGLLRGLFLGTGSHLVGLGQRMFGGQQLVVLGTRQIREEAYRIFRNEYHASFVPT